MRPSALADRMSQHWIGSRSDTSRVFPSPRSEYRSAADDNGCSTTARRLTYQSTLRVHMLGSALAPNFVTEARFLILSGKPGAAKRTSAITIAYRAIQNASMSFSLPRPRSRSLGGLRRPARAGDTDLQHPAALVVDEVGYLTNDTDAANKPFMSSTSGIVDTAP